MNQQIATTKNNQANAFTLIEVVVSIGIFSIILLIIAGLFTRFTFIERRDIGEQAIQEQLRFALEIFNREARTSYASTHALTDARGEGIVFRNQNSQCVHYRLFEGRVERADSSSTGDCTNAAFTSYSPLTSRQHIIIESLRFDIPNPGTIVADEALARQGYITLAISARAVSESVTPFRFQSTITSRQVIPYEENEI